MPERWPRKLDTLNPTLPPAAENQARLIGLKAVELLEQMKVDADAKVQRQATRALANLLKTEA